jgi:hypothetical protein
MAMDNAAAKAAVKAAVKTACVNAWGRTEADYEDLAEQIAIGCEALLVYIKANAAPPIA